MTPHPYYVLDVFAEEKYAGNQLCVVRNAANLPAETMQKIAREMNFSETAFILTDQPNIGSYDVRIFTREEELPFAGHPTLGTAYVILDEILKTPVDSVTLNLKAGRIPVSVRTDAGITLWMEQIPPTFGKSIAPEDVAPVIGVEVADIDPRFPIREVSTGLPCVIVPLKPNGSLRRANRSGHAFEAFLKKYSIPIIYLFTTETRDQRNQLAARMFSAYRMMPEDPATGSACGCLGGYLIEHQYFNDGEVDCRVEQGYEINRPSLLRVQAARKPGGIKVHVGGRVVMVARGLLV